MGQKGAKMPTRGACEHRLMEGLCIDCTSVIAGIGYWVLGVGGDVVSSALSC